MTEKSLSNLKPIRDHEDAVRRGRAGGKKGGENRRKRVALRESILAMLESGSTQDDIVAAIVAKALDGDVRAFESIRDTIGEKPADKLEVENAELQVNIHVE